MDVDLAAGLLVLLNECLNRTLLLWLLLDVEVVVVVVVDDDADDGPYMPANRAFGRLRV